MDAISTTALSFGVVLIVASWFYLITVSFKEDFSWGIVSVFVPVLSYIYAIANWEKGKDTVLMAAVGWLLVIFALV